jgi:hypothetical protein
MSGRFTLGGEAERDVFGVSIPLECFSGLALVHLRNVPGTSAIEAQAAKLTADAFPEPAVAEFVKSVCRWGGYAGVWGRVLRDNDGRTLRCAFLDATRRLGGTSPDMVSALASVDSLKGLGLSFASKHLRFLRPDLCPVFDSKLQAALRYPANRAGYTSFARDCRHLAHVLTERGAANPWPSREGQWFAADVEAVVFAFVQTEAGDWS